jgi:hypothetical protein
VAVDFSLDGSLAAVIPDARGVSTSVVTTNSGASPYVLKSALLREGATASVVYRGDGIRLYPVLLTNGEPRYAVRETVARMPRRAVSSASSMPFRPRLARLPIHRPVPWTTRI